MAEIAVLLAVKKIGIAVAGETLKFAGPLLANKSRSIAALPNDMKLMKNDLELIHEFLKRIGGKGERSGVTEAWIRQVRQLAYDMEDIVDQFIYVVGQHNQKGSWWSYIFKIVKKPQSLFSLDEIASEVKRINQVLQQAIQNRNAWTLDGGSGSTDFPVARYEAGQDLYLSGHDYSINNEDPVGPDKNKQTLTDSLHSEDPSLQISAVWGMGGIGKSTLVNNVYKKENSNFDCHAWVSISQSYELEDIWKKMLRDLLGKERRNFDFETKNSTELRAELMKILGGENRYLIVLDDVWAAKDLFRIKEVLVDNRLMSRVIVTTRSEEVASIADDGYKIKVQPLDDHYAWLLFCRKAFPRSGSNSFPDDLLQLGRKIVSKCKGLPLAIVAIGSLMSLKPKTVHVWQHFYDQLILELHRNENLNHVEKILNLSYKYLPDYLKNCFLYCAMFPEDDLIHRKKLIRLWTAEGFIERNGRQCSLEEVAEDYMEDLVRRSMLQVAERNSYNRIRCLQMHDLVRSLAIFQSAKESFSTTYDDTHGTAQVEVDLVPRRVSVLRCNRDTRLRIDASRLRTFIKAFDTSMVLSPWPAFIPTESKYLAVLDLSGLPIDNVPDSIGQLFNLKYLCLNDTSVKVLPNSITKLHNLETLSLVNTKCLNFPKGFANLKKLRYLLVWIMLDQSCRAFNSYKAMEPFEGLWNLKELCTLASVRASKMLVAKLGNFSQLGYLCITDVSSSQCAHLCHSLSKMHQLSKLEIRARNKDEMLHL